MRLNSSSISLLPPATYHTTTYHPTVAVRRLACHVEPCVVLRSRCVARYCAAVAVRCVACRIVPGCAVCCAAVSGRVAWCRVAPWLCRGVSRGAMYRAVVTLRCATWHRMSCHASHARMLHAAMCCVSHAGV